MRLPERELSLQQALTEFDVWITPTLGEIRDTDRFLEEMDRVVSVFDALEAATEAFSSVDHCNPSEMAKTYVGLLDKLSTTQAFAALQALASVLFLVTGKSDNNAKCQLPIFLRDVARWSSLPCVRRTKGKAELSLCEMPIPRELKAGKLMTTIAGMKGFPEVQQKVLDLFIRFVLSDQQYISQLWSVGKSYFGLKDLGKHRELLSPLVVFQVRGSVSASGGHNPEDILRGYCTDWGLESGQDFNSSDVVINDPAPKGEAPNGARMAREKTRAFDFVLPFRVESWKHRIFIQCQFYAGDSGSVSHKNVDQTTRSRAAVRAIYPDAIFVEYVDGAGYFSSLNGDLKTLLSMPTTKSFFQVRSAPIKLRRELQAIGFLTPLELEHAIACSSGSALEVREALRRDGYAAEEIERVIKHSIDRGFCPTGHDLHLMIREERLSVVRRYLLLDTIAREGALLESGNGKTAGCLLVPGIGPFFGMKMDEAVSKAIAVSPLLRTAWQNPTLVMEDIRVLREQGLILAG